MREPQHYVAPISSAPPYIPYEAPTLRDQFAMAALRSLVPHDMLATPYKAEEVASVFSATAVLAYALAESMLKARQS